MIPIKKPSGQTWAKLAYEFRERAEKAEAEVGRLRATVGDGFDCCGGSDETPPQHTQDCSAHPPRCVICGKCQSVAVVANTDVYEARCVACLLSLGAERQRKADERVMSGIYGEEAVTYLRATPLVRIPPDTGENQ